MAAGLARPAIWEYPFAIAMKSEQDTPQLSFTAGPRRYRASSLKEGRSKGYFPASSPSGEDLFLHAIRQLSAEDEEMCLPTDRGPIIYKDGIFQIDSTGDDRCPSIDPALKGLIDSILDPGRDRG